MPVRVASAARARRRSGRVRPGATDRYGPVLLRRSLPSPFQHLPAVAAYLTQSRSALHTALPYEELCVITATRLVGGPTRVILSEHSPP
jgi:hypothetical protein